MMLEKSGYFLLSDQKNYQILMFLFSFTMQKILTRNHTYNYEITTFLIYFMYFNFQYCREYFAKCVYDVIGMWHG